MSDLKMDQTDRRDRPQRSEQRREDERRGQDRRITLPGDWSGVERRENNRRETQERRTAERREMERRKVQDIIENGWPLIEDGD